MIITKKALPRRTVLRAGGAVLALPFLDSMAPALAAEGTKLTVEVRGKLVPATVTKMPFVPTRYKK